MVKREFTAVYKKEKKYFVAWVEEIPGVNTQGRTMREAKENLRDALMLILETNRVLALGRGQGIRREPLRIALV